MLAHFYGFQLPGRGLSVRRRALLLSVLSVVGTASLVDVFGWLVILAPTRHITLDEHVRIQLGVLSVLYALFTLASLVGLIGTALYHRAIVQAYGKTLHLQYFFHALVLLHGTYLLLNSDTRNALADRCAKARLLDARSASFFFEAAASQSEDIHGRGKETALNVLAEAEEQFRAVCEATYASSLLNFVLSWFVVYVALHYGKEVTKQYAAELVEEQSQSKVVPNCDSVPLDAESEKLIDVD